MDNTQESQNKEQSIYKFECDRCTQRVAFIDQERGILECGDCHTAKKAGKTVVFVSEEDLMKDSEEHWKRLKSIRDKIDVALVGHMQFRNVFKKTMKAAQIQKAFEDSSDILEKFTDIQSEIEYIQKYNRKDKELIRSNDDKRVMNSSIITSIKHQEELRDKISQNCKLTLLYKASIDGFGPDQFHSKCDNKGPTVTVISANYNVAGGFTKLEWKSSENKEYVGNDPSAFIFKLGDDDSIETFECHKQSHVIETGKNRGPVFGQGDIDLSNPKSGFSLFGSSYTLPEGVEEDSEMANFYLFGEEQVDDFEVFQVVL